MPTVAIDSKIQIDLQSVLDGISTLDVKDLESFASKINNMVAQKKAPSLSERESFLLQEINKGLPIEVQKRYRELITKLEQQTLTKSEHQELTKLVPIIEAKDVERLKYLVELAQIREITIDELMNQLGIKSPSYE